MNTWEIELSYLKETKELIRQALLHKGVSVDQSVPFRQYADLVKTIESGKEPVPDPEPTVGSINENNEITINEDLLANDEYSLQYEDISGNKILNFSNIGTFTVNKIEDVFIKASDFHKSQNPNLMKIEDSVEYPNYVKVTVGPIAPFGTHDRGIYSDVHPSNFAEKNYEIKIHDIIYVNPPSGFTSEGTSRFGFVIHKVEGSTDPNTYVFEKGVYNGDAIHEKNGIKGIEFNMSSKMPDSEMNNGMIELYMKVSFNFKN